MNSYKFSDDVPDAIRQKAIACLEEWGCIGNDKVLDVYPLAGGANNVNLVVADGQKQWAVKLRDAGAEHFNNAALVDAIHGQVEASRLGVAPSIYAYSPAGDFISEFIVGETLRPAAIREKAYAAQMVEAMRKLHKADPGRRRFDVFEDVRVFLRGTEAVNGSLPEGFDECWMAAQALEAVLARSNPPMGFIHGDLVPQNFLMCEQGIKFVDFDYCGYSLTALDLAGATSQAEMTAEETENFLQLYDPELDDGQRARVGILRFVNALREVSWAAMAEPRMCERATLLTGWSYKHHSDVNMVLAREFLAATPLDEVAARAAGVRHGALF
ncbi:MULTISPECIES: phosphotransferase [unclassified Mesorhizobium]|uniref:phosphotransferase n=1 Tax=unclassified Mesorhizobium TaxID=325217 RepID=UPI000FCC3027|nr:MULTISPECIES: phosphotransferase [unclassified Mesorhizobium]TGP21504.1 aminoglycoside phosphotransferase [Mesorhizobium sp. M1D.F.Ca.ET.231.01.1.1]TGP28950.1 aminoglycoside phosphotransferase [Mesorhizobium sp. M1D.F.Ca.ET.234.01.1.1]TGS43419.1 aminoglycoside phosphotransferase [Mesorhizobium sp. M1D.F.Ca.ET.184.01.1.1]TGS59966.1 aminoglycoside phosphotransferase [Mesorhizobium sp. M1D.F.Ca.ET.183.01.1.1]